MLKDIQGTLRDHSDQFRLMNQRLSSIDHHMAGFHVTAAEHQDEIETLKLRLDQIEGDVWTVPAESMKGRKGATNDFRVPLSAEAKRVIDLARPHARNGYLFPNTRGGVISDMTLSRHMERRGLEPRPHGFRTSLRTWLAEATDAPHEVAEAMLAHVVDGGVVRAYRRTDYLEQRAKLAERWADHVTGGVGKVVKLVEMG